MHIETAVLIAMTLGLYILTYCVMPKPSHTTWEIYPHLLTHILYWGGALLATIFMWAIWYHTHLS